ncbi:hypothetical protein EZV62_024407 [Acer yangbiense]|uniref:Leucine-rich repeat-containing N-terminal plant-type domain-containing protein n=1 Tax=Acer yangbiense TaxID=1000413 RepID=A0A5C7GW27_9ROSI|nr:hypothetical protein EZV62_024407 [Acer yangbiense]
MGYNPIEKFIFPKGNDETKGCTGLRKLKTLYLHGLNVINGSSLLQSLGSFPSLKTVDLRSSKFSDATTNRGRCEFVHLQELYLSRNNLMGTLPSCFANLTSLQVLDVSSNKLTGDISLSPVKSLISIQDLRLSNNHFQIPVSLAPFFNLSKLKRFYGENNEIYAETESHSLTPKFQLNTIMLSCCGDGGILPEFLHHQHDLREVDLSHNNLTGEFPNWLLENNTKLEYLVLANNSLAGLLQIPDSLSKAFNLAGLYLSDNKISGGIPSWLGDRPSLEDIIMPNNHLEGPIPLEFCRLNNLEVLNLAQNNISGSLPSCFSPPSITQVHLSKNRLDGQLKEAFYNSSSLVTLDLGYNRLDGSIPTWIGRLMDLTYLTLSNNNFEGELPTELCQLNQLRLVDLSQNNLFGCIPPCLDVTALHDSDHDIVSPSSISMPPVGYISMPPTYGSNSTSTAEAPNHGPPMRKEETVEFRTKNNSYFYQGKVLTGMSGIDLSCNKLTEAFELRKASITLAPPASFAVSKTWPVSMGVNWVIRLDLHFTRGWGLSEGYLNASLFSAFEQLQFLDLSSNSIAGFVDNGGLDKLSRLRNLEILDLAYNMFNNDIFSSINALPSLKSLYLFGNRLNETIDLQGLDKLSRLRNLEILDLGGNMFNNDILSSLNTLQSLKYLYLYGNRLNETVDLQGLDSLRNLEDLRMGFNPIEKFIFPKGNDETKGCTGLRKLKTLYLHGLNVINGSSLLQSLGSFPSLKTVDLRSSKFSDSTTNRGLCKFVHLQELYLSRNNLMGTLPSCFANLTSLRVLDVSSNKFTGDISLSPVKSLISIQDLRLSNNHFQIPLSLSPLFNLSKLKKLYGENNEIINAETESHSSAPKFQLNTIMLSCCRDGGILPEFIHHQHDLRKVDLSHNNLTGEFPNWLLENNTKLEYLVLANNSLAGLLQLPNHSLMGLTTLNISHNLFQGHIPKEIGEYLPSLKGLNLSRNAFDGSIPSSIGDMNSLQSLDLSFNQLSGKIPPQLVELDSLSFFSVAHNNLSGNIPKSPYFCTYGDNGFDGNPFLYGLPLSKSCYGTKSPSPMPRAATDNGEDNDLFETVSYIIVFLRIAAVLYINPYWWRSWFYFVETRMTSCYYFVVDNLPRRLRH